MPDPRQLWETKKGLATLLLFGGIAVIWGVSIGVIWLIPSTSDRLGPYMNLTLVVIGTITTTINFFLHQQSSIDRQGSDPDQPQKPPAPAAP